MSTKIGLIIKIDLCGRVKFSKLYHNIKNCKNESIIIKTMIYKESACNLPSCKIKKTVKIDTKS